MIRRRGAALIIMLAVVLCLTAGFALLAQQLGRVGAAATDEDRRLQALWLARSALATHRSGTISVPIAGATAQVTVAGGTAKVSLAGHTVEATP